MTSIDRFSVKLSVTCAVLTFTIVVAQARHGRATLMLSPAQAEAWSRAGKQKIHFSNVFGFVGNTIDDAPGDDELEVARNAAEKRAAAVAKMRP